MTESYDAIKVFVPISAVKKGEGSVAPAHDYGPIPGPIRSQNNPNKEIMVQEQPTSSISSHISENPYNLEKGSMIEFSNPPMYGVIKWIGYLVDISKKYKIAGVEMVNAIEYKL